jgi:hypothetical protein
MSRAGWQRATGAPAGNTESSNTAVQSPAQKRRPKAPFPMIDGSSRFVPAFTKL